MGSWTACFPRRFDPRPAAVANHLPRPRRPPPSPCRRAASPSASAVGADLLASVLVHSGRVESCCTGGAAPADCGRRLGGRRVRGQPRPLSARQEAVMAVIRFWITEHGHGHGPTVREIGTRVGLSSTSSVAYQLAQLAERGLISRTGREWRSCCLESPRPPRRGLGSR
ncbi:LexA family protein [Streptomyces microflavus]|uniref:LexA family protein n=1 Tax=Streptomyces microflavus TaxID=1919 RepID=UPI00368F3B78